MEYKSGLGQIICQIRNMEYKILPPFLSKISEPEPKTSGMSCEKNSAAKLPDPVLPFKLNLPKSYQPRNY